MLIGLIALFLVPVIYSQKDLIVNKGELMLNQSGILENESGTAN